MVSSLVSATHREATMNAQKAVAEPDLAFETAWSNLESECAAAEVKILDSDAVRSYMRIHPDMIALTGRLCSATRREFAAETLTLQMYVDPEIDDRYLHVDIRLVGYTPALVEQVMKRLDTIVAPFDEELCDATGNVMLMPRYALHR
jgi:hypothetical protein